MDGQRELPAVVLIDHIECDFYEAVSFIIIIICCCFLRLAEAASRDLGSIIFSFIGHFVFVVFTAQFTWLFIYLFVYFLAMLLGLWDLGSWASDQA